MSIQIEDCIDCMNVLYPQFECVFFLDHSNGHDRIRPDGLNAERVRQKWGGKQPKMRDTIIKDESYLGNFMKTLKVGDTQSMIFLEGDVGPFNLTPAVREAKKYDVNTGEFTNEPLSKKEIIDLLKAHNIVDPKGTKKQLEQKCNDINLPITKRVPIIREGWLGKPKGSLQILYERGFIDYNKLSTYSNKGSLTNGIRDEETSLEKLMLKLPDFRNEETVLQALARSLGVRIIQTPKCHPELAGEGIEYAWGAAKMFYRRQPLEKKEQRRDSWS